jgi:hypothetical protein
MPAIGLLPLTFATSPACAVYEQLLSEQANVILEAVGETIEKKLDEKFDPA